MELKTIYSKDVSIIEDDKSFHYQVILTDKLDNLSEEFTQNIINEIVLWKLNRYATISQELLKQLNDIKEVEDFSSKQVRVTLLSLLKTKGIRLPMASTILRFLNPNLFQIIDQRVYRVIYGKEFNNMIKNDLLIDVYFEYLKKLRDICSEYNIPFHLSDRWLYNFDKRVNKSIKIKY